MTWVEEKDTLASQVTVPLMNALRIHYSHSGLYRTRSKNY